MIDQNIKTNKIEGVMHGYRTWVPTATCRSSPNDAFMSLLSLCMLAVDMRAVLELAMSHTRPPLSWQCDCSTPLVGCVADRSVGEVIVRGDES